MAFMEVSSKSLLTNTVGEVTRLLMTAPLIIPFLTQYAPRIDKQKQMVISRLPRTIKLFCQDSGARLKPDNCESSEFIFFIFETLDRSGSRVTVPIK